MEGDKEKVSHCVVSLTGGATLVKRDGENFKIACWSLGKEGQKA